MPRTSYHTHSRFCDGEGEIADYVRAALDLGFSALGVSSHAPVPFPTTYAMALDALPAYCAEVRSLRERFDGRLDVWLSLEIDALADLELFYDERVLPAGFDYLIGSLHYIGREPGAGFWDFDVGQEEFDRGLRSWYEGDVRRVVEDYYAAVRRAVATGRYAIIGHVDRVKKYNDGERYFRESEPWYRDEAEAGLGVCAGAGVVVELNTAGYRRSIASPFPSPWIVRRCRELGIPMAITTDAHHPAHLDAHQAGAESVLREAGHAAVAVFRGGQWAIEKLEA